MKAELIDKQTGAIMQVSLDTMQIDSPAFLRLDLNRTDLVDAGRDGNDLVIRLASGETVRIANFYHAEQGVGNDLVIRDAQGSQWLVRPAANSTAFTLLNDLDELLDTQDCASTAESALLGLLSVGGVTAIGMVHLSDEGEPADSDPNLEPDLNTDPDPDADTEAPLPPLAQVTANGAAVTGSGEPGATIEVRSAAGTLLGSAIVAADGNYTAPLNPAQTNGETLSVTQADSAGNVSGATSALAPDLTAPPAPEVQIDADGAVVTGTGEPGATITVRDVEGHVIGTGGVAADGSFSVTLANPRTNGEALTVTQADAAGNQSLPAALTAPDSTAPDAPVATISADGAFVTGFGEAGATITVRDFAGVPIGTAQVAADGSYSVTLLPAQVSGAAVTVVQADGAGNVSSPTLLMSPDLMPPVSPVAAISGDGATVTGTGEPDAVVEVRTADGVRIGTGIAGADGGFTVTLAPTQTNGEAITVRQIDGAGNRSPDTSLVAPDLTAPGAPVGTVSGDGATLTGTGEPGATVTVRAPDGAIVGTASVAADGSFAASLSPVQANGQQLGVSQADGAGNVSPTLVVVAPDITAPSAPTAAIDADGLIVSGTGEPGATVTVWDGAGTVLGTGIVTAQGNYLVALNPAQRDSQTLSVSQSDVAGNRSPVVSVTAPDLTAPAAPTLAVAPDGELVSGTGEPGATVTIRDPLGTVIGTAIVAGDGRYTTVIVPAQVDGELLEAVQADAAGNISPPVTASAPDLVPGTGPDAPSAMVVGDGTAVTGMADPGALVRVTDANGVVLGSVSAETDGSYSVPLAPPLTNGETVRVTQMDGDGDVSPPATAFAPDLTAPAAPTATLDETGAIVTGTGEPGATVTVTGPGGDVIGVATVGAGGSYTVMLTPAQTNGETVRVVQADAAGNESLPVDLLAPDLTAPLAPTAIVEPDGATVSGTGEPGATVTVTDPNGTPVGTAVVASDGRYTATLSPAQTDGEILTVIQSDAAGNPSPPVSASAPDLTAPPAPTAIVSPDGTTVTGNGEAGATVAIAGPAGTPLGTAVVGADGSYSVTLIPPQTNGETLSVAQADEAGNISPPASAVAPDLTAPDAPTATVSPDGVAVTGTGEPGATVTVVAPGGGVVGTAIVAPDGSYSVPLTPPQANGELLGIVQSDPAGNVSPSVSATAPDITAPAAPTLMIAVDGASASGTGEPGAAITIRDPGGTVVGIATVAGDGSYIASLAPSQVNGEQIGATQTDGAGNVSPPSTALAPDLTAPAAPTATVSDDGTQVVGTGEPGAVIVITDPDGVVVGIATVAADGGYVATLSPRQVDGELLVAIQSDTAGNESPPATASAPDLTAPVAPTGAVAPDGTSVSGTGEPGATIRINGPGGLPLGTALVAVDGSYTAILNPPQTDGEFISVVQRDPAGNASPSLTLTAPDLTAPEAPGAAINGDGTLVTGTGEPGATVRITGPGGALLGTAVVAADGGYTAALSPPQANGQPLSAIQSDAAGNASPGTPLIAPDITAPPPPGAIVSPEGTAVTGTGEPGAMVTVRDVGGMVLGTALVAGDGSYSVALTPARANGEQLAVSQADAAGNTSPSTQATAPDITAPDAPTASVSPDGAIVTGTGEPGATVTVRDPDGAVIGTATVAANGGYSVTLTVAQDDGQVLTVTQADQASNVSPAVNPVAPDGTAPPAPTASVTADGAAVVGTGVAGSTITVRGPTGTVIGTALVAADGSYSAMLTPPQRNGELLGVTQADDAGNNSPPVPVAAPDLTAPDAPTLAVSGDGTTVTGTGEVGATVRITDATGDQIGTAVVGANGSYTATLAPPQANGQTVSATQTDVAGNPSIPASAVAPDITAPLPPAALAVSADGTALTGTGEPGATVEVRTSGGALIGSGIVAEDGGFLIGLAPPQVSGGTLGVMQADAAGNRSGTANVAAPFDIDAFDNSNSVNIDLLPVTASVNHGSAAYVTLVSLGLLNLDAQVLGTPSVEFTVADGHSLDATFTYDTLLNIGVLSGYTVIVQRFDGTNWVAIEGLGNSSLLQLGLLNGDLVANETLGPGQYRAFLTFQGALGTALFGNLNVGGIDSDFTDIGGVEPGTATGNVITDPGPGDAVDVVSPGTVVTSITVNGVTTPVTADGTIINGAWGTLTIDRDGGYSYTPSASAAAIGQTDSFTYTLRDPGDGELESATLTIAIGSDDIAAAPVAANDSAIAGVSYQNVVTDLPAVFEFSFNTPGALLVPATREGGDTFTVAPGSSADITITAIRTGLLTLLPTYTITVRDAGGAVVGTVTQTAVAGLPLGSGVSFTLHDLPPGTYSYTVSSTNTVGTPYGTSVYVAESVTHLDRFVLTEITPATGDLLDNDVVGSAFATVRIETADGFTEVGDAPLTVNGRYGTLRVDETGTYVYTPHADLPYAPADLSESFTYQIVQPGGAVSTATLTLTIDMPADGVAGRSLAGAAMDEPDIGSIQFDALLEGDREPGRIFEHGSERDSLARDMFAGPGELEAVLDAYLGDGKSGPEKAMIVTLNHPMQINDAHIYLNKLQFDDELARVGGNFHANI